MSAIQMPKVFKNFNLFIAGEGFAGRVSKVKLPTISVQTEDHKGAGMEFNRKLDMGLEDLECTFTLTEYNDLVNGLVGKRNGSNTLLTFRGSLSDDESTATTPVVAQMRGALHKQETGDIEAGGKIETDYTLNCKFYELKIGGQEIYHIDNDNYIRRIQGEDQLASQRGDLGL